MLENNDNFWTDELAKEFAEQYRFSSSKISVEQFKESKQKPKRIEVEVFGASWVDDKAEKLIVAINSSIPEEKFPTIKQAIESIINDDVPEWAKDFKVMNTVNLATRYFYSDGKSEIPLYTKEELEQAERIAFEVARKIPLKVGGIASGFDIHIFQFPTFEDYVNFKK